MNIHDTTYRDALADIITNGQTVSDRTGVGTKSLFGVRQEYNLAEGFPAITLKKLAWKAVVSELLWFLEGSDDERRLCEILHGTRDASKKTIWTQNATAPYWLPKARFTGDVGSIYGVQWRSWMKPDGSTVDQVTKLIEGLINKPHDRRHILSAWNPGELEDMALPPCHSFCQFYVGENNTLDCQMYQRSNDFFLGCPFNIASYSLLLMMIAQVTNLVPGRLIHITGDAHVYLNHFDQARELINRTPFATPKVVLNPNITSIDQFTMSDIQLIDYNCHSALTAPMAV